MHWVLQIDERSTLGVTNRLNKYIGRYKSMKEVHWVLQIDERSALGAINDLAQVRQDLEPFLRSHLVRKFH